MIVQMRVFDAIDRSDFEIDSRVVGLVSIGGCYLFVCSLLDVENAIDSAQCLARDMKSIAKIVPLSNSNKGESKVELLAGPTSHHHSYMYSLQPPPSQPNASLSQVLPLIPTKIQGPSQQSRQIPLLLPTPQLLSPARNPITWKSPW